MTLWSVTNTTRPKSWNKVELESCLGLFLHSEYELQSINVTETERERKDLQASCIKDQGWKYSKDHSLPDSFHLLLHRESPVFSSIKSHRGAAH